MRVWEISVEILPENSFYVFLSFIIIYILFYIFYLKNFSRTKNFFIFITWLYISFLLSISFLPLWIIPEKFSDFNITEKIIEYKIYSSFYVPLLHILVFIPLGFLFSYFNYWVFIYNFNRNFSIYFYKNIFLLFLLNQKRF